ncbi:MAG TPA: adenylyl-sulfate kinase [Bacteroidia bacterium]|jgi:adenylylsulfate kinase|nr:adenylyl-sulfate kinase [Bacteroidia bacterium]
MAKETNIFPTDKILLRADKEKLLQQRGVALWFTGLSGSGKTTIAIALEQELNKKGLLTQILDGDNIRAGINNNLGFSEADRTENIRRIAEITKLFVNCGVITICCFVSPTEEIRSLAKSIIGKPDFVEIFVNTPLATCEQRDVKGLYAKARKGEIKDFTGISSPFESPKNPEIEVKTNELSVQESVNRIIEKLEIK